VGVLFVFVHVATAELQPADMASRTSCSFSMLRVARRRDAFFSRDFPVLQKIGKRRNSHWHFVGQFCRKLFQCGIGMFGDPRSHGMFVKCEFEWLTASGNF
jgi:hypothetical protein